LAVVAPAQAAGGYPWANVGVGQMDSWGFNARQCTSYVAWRLHQSGDAAFQDNMIAPTGRSVQWGNADHWAIAARQLGYVVSKTPAVGTVAQWNSFEKSSYKGWTITASAYGHVAYVVAVYSDGSVKVDEYDATRSHGFSTERLRAPRFLYIRG
jgi:surface antigen